MRWLTAALAFAVLVVAASAVQTRPADADPPITGYPDSIAVLGDSISRAFDADGSFGEQLPNVWATGTSPSVNSLYSRILAVHPPISGHAINVAVTGAKLSALNGQANNAVGQNPALVLILMGANDVCTSSEATMTDTTSAYTFVNTALNTLSAGLPNARIVLFSIPDVYNLWDILHTDSTATSRWTSFNICQSLLANPTSMAPTDVQRRANVRQRNIDLNTVLHDTCALFVHCYSDNYLGFNTTFTPSHVSTLDYFHPSVAGEALIASTAWDNGIEVTDTTLPTSGGSATFVGGASEVSLTASDDVGVNGIEYKIGSGPWAKYNSPVTVATPTNFTWRAVDVSGNTEATHTCYLGGWTWPAGDTDCDGFPDSVPIDPPNALSSEADMITDPAGECASTTGTSPAVRNDEPPPDRWPVDFDDNGLVNGSDLLTFAPVFGSVSPNPPFNPRFDLNNSDSINGSDLLKLAPFFSKHCAP